MERASEMRKGERGKGKQSSGGKGGRREWKEKSGKKKKKRSNTKRGKTGGIQGVDPRHGAQTARRPRATVAKRMSSLS
jgi:hypothetical protein